MTTAGDERWLDDVYDLEHDDVHAVLSLIEQVTDADGVRPLDEHALLHIRRGGDVGARHLLTWNRSNSDAAAQLVGYAHFDSTDEVAGPVAQLAVHPQFRRQGIGRSLVQAIIDRCSESHMRLWAHGESTASAHLAGSMGFTSTRVLWQMRRSLSAALPRLVLPEGVRIRAFEPGHDDDAWVVVNARAFENHPDQGRWTLDDLHLRMREPWFDPTGFLLAVTGTGVDEQIAGFHWTKVHGSDNHGHGHGHAQLGEVFVVGVDPDWQRKSLGRSLTVAGLVHLRSRGLDQAMLYVDARNTNAIKVYESLGFARWDTDVLFTRVPS
ncbi:MAG: mycothiol synthase [Actinomycetes bacterium]